MAKVLQVNLRIVEQLAKATITNLIDGIVELVTNCDDSYRRLEETGKQVNGEIEIYVNRKTGGICENLVVKDWAEGMSRSKLEKALEFGGETSGFEKGRSVRGLFGRGLKETIIALGEGNIKTIKNGKECRTKLWFDKKLKQPQYDDELLEKVEDTAEKDGTHIDIKITNEKIKIPKFEKFYEQISKHYALRDISRSNARNIKLIFDDLNKIKITKYVKHAYPEGEKVVDKEINLPFCGDKIKLVIYESSQPLESPRYNPFGLAGILIKTKSAILDNQLFKYSNNSAALYFFGEAICDGLETKLRKGETELINFNRGGLEWKHEYCQALSSTVEKVLEPLVSEKQKRLEKKPEKKVQESTKKMLRKLSSLLNEIAKQELEEMEWPVEPTPDIESMVIKPEIANIQLDKPRTFSIYAPEHIVDSEGQKACIKSDSVEIIPLASEVRLERHSKYPQIYCGYFKIVGRREGEEGFIEVKLGRQNAKAKIKVAPQKAREKGKITGRKRGFISDITPNDLPSPPQRVVYTEGVIEIYVRFPSVLKFIKSGLEGVETAEGKMLLAELVGEAFCKQLAMKGMGTKYLKIPGGEIDSFNAAVNELQKKHLHRIQEIIFAWKF